MGGGARAWPDAIMPTLVAHCPGMQCAMVGACCYSTCHAVPALVAEVERLRAALRGISDVLGGGPCSHIGCEGCAHEFAEAADIADEALDASDS